MRRLSLGPTVTWPEGSVLEVGVEFLAAAADGIGVQPGDLRQQFVAAVADLFGLQGGQPAALLLVQAAEVEVDAMMALAIGMIRSGSANRALALVDDEVGHDIIS